MPKIRQRDNQDTVTKNGIACQINGRLPSAQTKHMNSTNTTTIQHISNGQGIGALAALTGAQIVYDDTKDSVSLHFPKMVGKAGGKFKVLEITLNHGTDLYDLKAYKLNKKTFQIEVKEQVIGCYNDQLNQTAENLTGLCLRF